MKAVWLVAGLGYQAFALSGCTGQLGVAGAEALGQATTHEAGAAETSESSPRDAGVRISRAFFEKSIVGRVKFADDELDSDVVWQVAEPRAPLPTEPVLADFRDRQGCALYENTDGVRLCFNVIADVSSLGVNAEEVRAEGLCGGRFANVRFVSATRGEGVLAVTFEGDCQGTRQTAELTLRQI